MMIERMLLDTNVIIYSLGGNKHITRLITSKEHFISEITEIELLGFHGLTREDEKILSEYLQQTFIIGLNSAIKNSAIDLKRVYRLKTVDAIVAASALYFELPLVTADKQFKQINELEVILVTP
jgi:predicted nucleic acid-binding protein